MGLKTTQPKAITPAKLEAEMVKLDAGLMASIPVGTVFTIHGTPLKQAQIDAQYQAWLAVFRAVDLAKQAYLAAVAARLAITVDVRTFNKAFKSLIRGQYGHDGKVLASFGMAPDTTVATTAQQKLVAAAKRSQTRKVRGTRGKKQKAALTVVGNPPISVASDGSLEIAPPPINLPAASNGAANLAATPTPSGSAGETPDGSGRPPGA